MYRNFKVCVKNTIKKPYKEQLPFGHRWVSRGPRRNFSRDYLAVI